MHTHDHKDMRALVLRQARQEGQARKGQTRGRYAIAALLALGLMSSSLSALSFGTMGNYNAGMGGAGVAVTGSQYGLYYNPALLGQNHKARIAYSLGISIQSKLDASSNGTTNANADASASAKSQNALLFAIKGNNNRGAIAFGTFINLYGSARMKGQVDVNNQNAQVAGGTSSMLLLEVPIGYGHKFKIGNGNFSMGLALKYIYARAYKDGGITESTNDIGVNFLSGPYVYTNNFGVDIGFLYEIHGFTLGATGKYLNSPKIRLSDGSKMTIRPQGRLGIAYNKKFFTIAADIDLVKNKDVTGVNEQMVGGGIILDGKYADIRLGAKYDMQNHYDNGVIVTAGLNLLGFLDVAVESGFKQIEVGSMKLPTYIALKVGGGFSW